MLNVVCCLCREYGSKRKEGGVEELTVMAGTSPTTIALSSSPHRLVITMLTRCSVPNATLWRQWARKQKISFVLNAKHMGGVDGLPPRVAKRLGTLSNEDRVVDTAWGSHTLCIAHQAMLRVGLKRHPDAAWFMLVSGDSIPIISAKQLMSELHALGPHHSLLGQFACGPHVVDWLWHHRTLRGDSMPDNWWVRHLDAGVLTSHTVRGHQQMVLFCRTHATVFADMPVRILQDYDELLDVDIKKNKTPRLSAEEVVPFTYLATQGCGDHILDMDAMLSPFVGKHGRDFKGRIPIRIIKHADEVDGKPVFFLRKISVPLSVKERKRLRSVWRTRPSIFVSDATSATTKQPSSPPCTRARKRQRRNT